MSGAMHLHVTSIRLSSDLHNNKKKKSQSLVWIALERALGLMGILIPRCQTAQQEAHQWLY